MAGQPYQSITLPVALIDRLRRESRELGVPLPWLVAAFVAEIRCSAIAPGSAV